MNIQTSNHVSYSSSITDLLHLLPRSPPFLVNQRETVPLAQFVIQGTHPVEAPVVFFVTARRLSDRQQPVHDICAHDRLPVVVDSEIPRVLALLRPDHGKLACC